MAVLPSSVLFIPIFGLLTYLLVRCADQWFPALFLSVPWIKNPGYAVSIAVTGSLIHFIHDSRQKQGLHWFSPFSWKHYTLESGVPQPVSDAYVRWFYQEHCAHREHASSGDEFTERIPDVSAGQIITFLVCGYALALFWVWR